MNNFVVLDSIYGKFIINRHCHFQAEALIKTGVPHIQSELNQILGIVNTLPEGCVVVDAGANAGLVTIPIAQVIKDRGGRVHAYEYQWGMVYALGGTVMLNDLTNIEIYHCGLGAREAQTFGTMPDYSIPQDLGLFSMVNKVEGLKCRPELETVRVRTLDTRGLPRLDFFKIDVEGMEIDVLNGAKETIAKFKPWIWVEYHKVGIEALKEWFKDTDYKLYIADGLNMICAPPERSEKFKIELPEA